MTKLDELCHLSRDEFISWVEDQDKQTKKELKELKYHLEIKCEIGALKLKKIIQDQDTSNIKIMIKYNASKQILLNLQDYVNIVSEKMEALEQHRWDALSELQQQELIDFEQSLSTYDEDTLINTIFVDVKSNCFQLKQLSTHCSQLKEQPDQTPAQHDEIQLHSTHTKTALIFSLFQLRLLEQQLLKFRITRIASLSPEIRVEAEAFKSDLSTQTDEIKLAQKIDAFKAIAKCTSHPIAGMNYIFAKDPLIKKFEPRLIDVYNYWTTRSTLAHLHLAELQIHLLNLQLKRSYLSNCMSLETPVSIDTPHLEEELAPAAAASNLVNFSYKDTSVPLTFTQKRTTHTRSPLFPEAADSVALN